jgi:hypothetical protein
LADQATCTIGVIQAISGATYSTIAEFTLTTICIGLADRTEVILADQAAGAICIGLAVTSFAFA